MKKLFSIILLFASFQGFAQIGINKVVTIPSQDVIIVVGSDSLETTKRIRYEQLTESEKTTVDSVKSFSQVLAYSETFYCDTSNICDTIQQIGLIKYEAYDETEYILYLENAEHESVRYSILTKQERQFMGLEYLPYQYIGETNRIYISQFGDLCRKYLNQ